MTKAAHLRFAVLLLVLTGTPSLRSLAAGAAIPLNDLVARTSTKVSGLLDEFSDVKCTERVLQEKLSRGGKVEYKEESSFDYLVILTNVGGELTLDESRVEQEKAAHKKNLPLLVSNGFAMGFLVFHPYYISSFDFRDDGEDTLDGKLVRKVHFRHIRGTRSITALTLRGREYPLEMEGDAWIDPASGAIERISSAIPVGIDDLGLRAVRTDVTYAPVAFHDAGGSPWLPLVATVDVETPRQHWRNTHRFSDYKRFSVSTQESVREESLNKK